MPETTHRSHSTTTATLVHVVGLVFGFVGAGIVYLLSDDEFVTENARNAFNWQVSFLLAVAALVAVASLETFTSVALGGLGIVALVSLVDPVLCLLAAVRANRGVAWDYRVALPVL